MTLVRGRNPLKTPAYENMSHHETYFQRTLYGNASHRETHYSTKLESVATDEITSQRILQLHHYGYLSAPWQDELNLFSPPQLGGQS